MEIHSVLPEERARTETGDFLPWGYRYADSSKNPRLPEESGPFGRNRNIRYTPSGGRRASTRQGTTPVRQKQENNAVSEFSRLFAKEQQSQPEEQPQERKEADPEPTECMIYGYVGKSAEWKVLSRYERVVAPGIIIEDYPRDDPVQYLNTNSPQTSLYRRPPQRHNLSQSALAKSRIYRGGQHWIKVTFDSYEAAERACFYSPIEIDGYQIHCEMWQGQGPSSDVALPINSARQAQTIGPAQTRQNVIAGFEQALQSSHTLPRNQKLPDKQFGQPDQSSDTASSATAQSPPAEPSQLRQRGNRSDSTEKQLRNQPQLQQMTHIPSVRRLQLRPLTEALPPQKSQFERTMASLPIIGWLLGYSVATEAKRALDVINDGGPVLKEDGTWDDSKNGWYWGFWFLVDRWFGTDFCALKEE